MWAVADKVSMRCPRVGAMGLARLTTSHIESLGREGDSCGTALRSRDLSDPATRGLVLRISPQRKRAWLFRYKWHGRPVRLALGAYPSISLADARRLAHEFADFIQRGIDPRQARDQKRPVRAQHLALVGTEDKHSVEFLAREYMDRHVRKRQKRPDYVDRILKTDVLPKWIGRDARTIKAREVVELIDKV